jgi:hypothetical protein
MGTVGRPREELFSPRHEMFLRGSFWHKIPRTGQLRKPIFTYAGQDPVVRPPGKNPADAIFKTVVIMVMPFILTGKRGLQSGIKPR